jgi:hypothetical protein
MPNMFDSWSAQGALTPVSKALTEALLERTREPSTLGSLAASSGGNALANALSNDARPLHSNLPWTLAHDLLQPETKRKAYFAFRFEDIMRVNNVRNAWKFNHPESLYKRSFFDRSIWGKSDAQKPESLKALMRGAVVQSSAICVLIGTHTWQGRWVKYEIARSVIDERGLLGVHINGIKHIERLAADAPGLSPLHFMGIFHSPNGLYYLYESFLEFNGTTELVALVWRPYQDFTDPVPLPRYIPSIQQGLVMPLARYTQEYDYVADGGKTNIGAWIDKAASAVGR